jgi:putative SOS response-associated peptidase YedK
MKASAFDMDGPLDERRIIIRCVDGGIEMVELPWGLKPREPGGRPFNLVRSEGRTFPSHRCLVPASEFRLVHRGRHLDFLLADSDWFYFAGIWRPATQDWPEAYAILTIEANPDVAPYQDRQMAVLRRQQRMAWLGLSCPPDELLRPLPRRTFRVAPQVARDLAARPVHAQPASEKVLGHM